jgi:hypothetical protein
MKTGSVLSGAEAGREAGCGPGGPPHTGLTFSRESQPGRQECVRHSVSPGRGGLRYWRTSSREKRYRSATLSSGRVQNCSIAVTGRIARGTRPLQICARVRATRSSPR